MKTWVRNARGDREDSGGQRVSVCVCVIMCVFVSSRATLETHKKAAHITHSQGLSLNSTWATLKKRSSTGKRGTRGCTGVATTLLRRVAK